jgi:hypothetical protein
MSKPELLTYVVVKIWDLRCLVWEKLVAFVQENYPQCLPRFRAELKQQ